MGTLAVETKTSSWHLNGFPNVTTSGQQYNIGEKPSVILYTYIIINLHAGTPKPQSFYLSIGVPDYSSSCSSNMVLEKLNNFINISI